MTEGYIENGSPDSCDVCEMDLAALKDIVTEERMRQIQTFCSEECRQKFLEDPEKYFSDEEELE